MKACIKYGIKENIDSKVVDINNQADCADLQFPESGWEEFIKAITITDNFHFIFGPILLAILSPMRFLLMISRQ